MLRAVNAWSGTDAGDSSVRGLAGEEGDRLPFGAKANDDIPCRVRPTLRNAHHTDSAVLSKYPADPSKTNA